MSRLYTLLIICLLFANSANKALAEVITNFDASYQINADATVVVQENITYDFGSEDRHGIFRIIKNRHPQGASAWYKNRLIDIEVKKILRDGLSEPFVLNSGLNDIEIKVGNADSTISGAHVYQIEYQLVGALSYGESGTEFYWNVTGNDWPISIEKVTASVYSDALTGTAACYKGTVGDTDECDSIKPSNSVITFSQEQIPSGEGLTIATALTSSKVATVNSERFSFLLLGIIFGPFWLIGIFYWLYKARTSEYSAQPVIAQYEPYADFLPMYTGVLADGRLDPRDITAGILYLAEQGHFKIAKTTRKVLLVISISDYDITLTKPITDALGDFLPKLSKLLFSAGASVGSTVALSSLASKKTQNAAIVTKLQTAVKADLIKNGFRDSSSTPYFKQVLFLIFLSAVLFAPILLAPNGFILWSLIVVFTIVVTCCVFIARITKKGYEARNHVQGFKLFLSVTDKERFDFFNAPEKSPELFMKFLPYAVALGVEKKWATVFEGITIPNPDWYEGGNFAAFNAGALTSDLGSFSTAFASNSGTSGSSGGGASGGGGGGGGGGSW